MNMNYDCLLYGEDSTKTTTLPFLNLKMQMQLHVEVSARKQGYVFRIGSVSILEATYEQIDDFQLVNYLSLLSKVNLILANLKNVEVFGTGFPALATKNPQSAVSSEYTHFFDPEITIPTVDIESR